MKLIWLLIKEGVIELDEPSFRSMWEIYDRLWITHEGYDYTNQSIQPITHDLELFKILLNNVQVKQPHCNVRLLGDIFADRGANDYLTLSLLRLLGTKGFKPEIMFSNHDLWLLRCYKKPVPVDRMFGVVNTLKNPNPWVDANFRNQENALVGLYTCIRLGLIDQREVVSIVETYVEPFIAPLAYFLSADRKKIDLFMHAPNSFVLIKNMAQALRLKEPTSAVELAQVIDTINAKFSRLQTQPLSYENVLAIASKYSAAANGGLLVDANYLNSLNIDGRTFTDEEALLGCFLSMLTWNRNANLSDYPTYVSHIVHGHDGQGQAPYAPFEINLDNILGKAQSFCQGIYSAFFTMTQPRPPLPEAPQMQLPEEVPQLQLPQAPQPVLAPLDTVSQVKPAPTISIVPSGKNAEYFQALHPDIREEIREVAPVIHATGHGWGTTLSAIFSSIGNSVSLRPGARMSSTIVVIQAINSAYISSNWQELESNLKILGIDSERASQILEKMQLKKYGDIEEADVEEGFVLLKESSPSP